jgi:hypothetical protein
LADVVSVAGRRWQGLALKSDGTVFGFGHDMFGGNDVPVGLSNAVSIAVEGNSCWAIRRDGTVAMWGNSDQDDLNIVVGLTNITSIAWGGYRNYLALKKDGTGLGFNFENALFAINPATGLPSALESPVRPIKVRGQVLSNIVALASMGMTPIVLKSDGTVFSLGYQTPDKPPVQPQYEVHDNVLYEQLGGESAQLPYRYTSADPVMIEGKALSNVVALASGGMHCLALKRDGTVVAWGDAPNSASAVPAGLSNVVAIATDIQSLALKRDGTVVVWGGDSHFGQTSVPAGLSNVVAIATTMDFSLAVTTGKVPSSVFIQPHGRIEEMAAAADLVFKGRVVSTHAVTNAAFPLWGQPYETKFNIISVLKGNIQTNMIAFLHITGQPGAWSGGAPPQNFKFEVGQSYLTFAAMTDKPDYHYSPPSNNVVRLNEFRQLMHGEIASHTLDKRPLDGLSVKDAQWVELNLLLKDTNPTNQLYAIGKIDSLSLAGRGNDEWSHSPDFKRKTVLSALQPLITNRNEQVAIRAINCFKTGSNSTATLESFANALVKVVNGSSSFKIRLSAISALSGSHFEAVSNSLGQLLQNPNSDVRSKAVALLALYPGDFAEQLLRECANDKSPSVRAGVADVIGNGKLLRLAY